MQSENSEECQIQPDIIDKVNLIKTYTKYNGDISKLEIIPKPDNTKHLCILCIERQADAVLIPCGHANLCFFCSYKIYRSQKACHLCR